MRDVRCLVVVISGSQSATRMVSRTRNAVDRAAPAVFTLTMAVGGLVRAPSAPPMVEAEDLGPPDHLFLFAADKAPEHRSAFSDSRGPGCVLAGGTLRALPCP